VLHLLAREIGDRATVLWFNPWLFAGAEQLVSSFFGEVAGLLKTGRRGRLKEGRARARRGARREQGATEASAIFSSRVFWDIAG
jgi:hypothetical protein